MCDVVQVDNIYNTLNCDVVQVENIFNTLSCDVVQVDDFSIATAHGSDLVQVDKLLNCAPAQGGPVVQVENVLNSDAPSRGSDIVAQVGDIYIPTKPHREGLHRVICSRGVKRMRS